MNWRRHAIYSVATEPVPAPSPAVHPWGVVDDQGRQVLMHRTNGQTFPCTYRTQAGAERCAGWARADVVKTARAVQRG